MCTTLIFGPKSTPYLAENYDHSLDHGLVAINLRGTQKENGRAPGEQALRWRVQYGSLTFNQFALELPVSGMNEAGLSVALMWHYEGNFGTQPQYTRLSALQWIQYQLDNYQTIAEVLAGLQEIRPKQEGAPLHYSLLDAKGNSLLLEFIDGEAQTYLNPAYPILANSSYAPCLEQAEQQQPQNAAQVLPENSSQARFLHLYRQYPQYQGCEIKAEAGFELLQSVSQTPNQAEPYPWNQQDQTLTAWSLVFNPSTRSILLKTHQNPAVREFHLSDFDFSPASEYVLMDINQGSAGNARSYFEPYTQEHHQRILSQTAQFFPMPESAQAELLTLVDHLYRQRKMPQT